MAYLIKNKQSRSFIKKVRFMQKELVIKKYIGKYSGKITKEQFMLKNMNELTSEELKFRKRFLNKIQDKLSYSQTLPEKVEKKSILIDNLIEIKNNKDLIYNEFAKEFIFNSNNIEGSKIPKNEVIKILETGKSKYRNKNEIKEVENSIKSFEYLLINFKFNLASIKRLYYILTKNLNMEGDIPYPRGFKDVANVVNNKPTTNPENVEKELQNLLNWYKKNRKKEHPLILAFKFHKIYEMIHPFLDGNGRTGRLIMNKILISKGYFPLIVYKTNKLSYFNALDKATEGRNKKYYQFMLEQADKTYDFILKTIDKY